MAVWTLRPGREDDVRPMYMLDLVCFEEPFRFDLQSMLRFLLQPGAIVVVAEAEGQSAGLVVVHLVRQARQRAGYVVTLDVAREFRRMGLAKALMQEAEMRVKDAGAAAMALHVFAGNAAAIAFYERVGYLRGDGCEAFYGDGLDAWRYGKGLE